MDDAGLKKNMRKDFLSQLEEQDEVLVGDQNIIVKQPREDRLYDNNGKVLDENYITNLTFKKVKKNLTKKVDYNVLSKVEIEKSPSPRFRENVDLMYSTQTSVDLDK